MKRGRRSGLGRALAWTFATVRDRNAPRHFHPSRYAPVLFVLLCSASASAQLVGGGGEAPGADPVGLAVAGFEGLDVIRAEVDVDLRTLHASPRVGCDTIYTVTNRSAEPVESRVVVLQGSSEYYRNVAPGADLDGVALAAPVRATHVSYPSWYITPRPPAPPGYSAEAYSEHDGAPYTFALRIPPGEHRVRVRQQTWTFDRLDRQKLFGQYLFEYHVSPARGMPSLREIVFRARVPHAWLLASNPPLSRTGDTFTGRWSAMRGDTIALSVHVPRKTVADARAIPWVLLLAGLVGAWVAGAFVGRRIARTGRRWRVALAGVPIALVVAPVLVYAGDMLADAVIAQRVGYGPAEEIGTALDACCGSVGGSLLAACLYAFASNFAYRRALRSAER